MKISVIVPVFNNLEYTKDCVTDLLNCKNLNLEIIVIDNGSTDKTMQFLKKFSELIVISNSTNLGCAYSWNQGLSKSTGDWIIVLNNDVRIPKNCFYQLIESSIIRKLDIASPGMREGQLDYNLEIFFDEFTSRMKTAFRKWTPSGVCFALRRSVVDKVGFFDENYKIGQYEDADFFRRCKNAKLKMGITGASFIHHFGSSTQKYLKEKGATGYALKNRNYHRKKWKLGFFQRNFERYREQLLTKIWSYKERFQYGHSLLERSEGQKISYL